MGISYSPSLYPLWHALSCVCVVSYKVTVMVIRLYVISGYGDIYPCGVWGQFVSVLACLFGVPLTLWCMTRLGTSFEIFLNNLWIKGKRLYNRVNKRVKPASATKPITPDIVPVWFGLCITGLWILLSSVYFHYTLSGYYKDADPENLSWNFFSAFYFTFISVASIGYGDISPLSYNLVIPNYMFIFMGIALVTMCITIIQRRAELLFDETVRLIKDRYSNALQQPNDDHTVIISDDDTKPEKVNAKKLVRQLPQSGWISNFISSHDRERLNKFYEIKSHMTNIEVQTDDFERRVGVQATVEMLDDVMMTDLVTMDRHVQCNTIALKEIGIQTDPAKVGLPSKLKQVPVFKKRTPPKVKWRY